MLQSMEKVREEQENKHIIAKVVDSYMEELIENAVDNINRQKEQHEMKAEELLSIKEHTLNTYSAELTDQIISDAIKELEVENKIDIANIDFNFEYNDTSPEEDDDTNLSFSSNTSTRTSPQSENEIKSDEEIARLLQNELDNEAADFYKAEEYFKRLGVDDNQVRNRSVKSYTMKSIYEELDEEEEEEEEYNEFNNNEEHQKKKDDNNDTFCSFFKIIFDCVK